MGLVLLTSSSRGRADVKPTARSRTTTGALDLVSCPECQGVAEVERRHVLESTEGPVEHLKIRCLHGHWFLVPVALLPPQSRC
jgi:hypothetical protein